MNLREVFSEEEIMEAKRQGHSEQEMQQMINEAQAEESTALQTSYQNAVQRQQMDPMAFSSNSFIKSVNNENLIQWQLELDSILERAEHLLRGDKPAYKGGSVIWESPEKANQVLSDYGVAECMRILLLYVNRNTILSNYSEEIIDLKMYDLGMELADLFFMKYESMGLDDLEKRKMYPMIVREIVDIVHSTYLRGLNGGERESLREARQVVQNQNFNPMGMPMVMMGGQPQKQRGLLNPMRYIKGKYG